MNTPANAKPCEKYVIKGLDFDGAMKAHLTELGFTVGAEIECVLVSAHGDMRAFLIRGAIIALRTEDLCKFSVE